MTNSTQESSLVIRYLREGDIDGVAAVHIEQFPGSRSTLVGERFVRKMYRWFVTEQPELALVATIDGQPVGFAVGAIGGYGRRIFRYALSEILWGFICHPALLFRQTTFTLWTSYAQALLPNSAGRTKSNLSHAGMVKASLASIAVSQSAQGRGIGKGLLLAFEEAAKQTAIAREKFTALKVASGDATNKELRTAGHTALKAAHQALQNAKKLFVELKVELRKL